MKTLAKF